jgi:hypothetical protein
MSRAQTIAVSESGEWLVRVSPLVQMGYSAERGRSRLRTRHNESGDGFSNEPNKMMARNGRSSLIAEEAR